ncbi:MAG: hypothetical protein NTX72_04600 [Candidatus Uhrbacteria bacterium]|nr:hypothetical protein [Candidatus Uhrbacteria bacterium]
MNHTHFHLRRFFTGLLVIAMITTNLFVNVPVSSATPGNTITVTLGSANPIAKSVYHSFSMVPMLQFDVTSAAEVSLSAIKFTPTYTGTGGANDYGIFVSLIVITMEPFPTETPL